MLATFSLGQPIPLLAAIVILAGGTALLRSDRVASENPDDKDYAVSASRISRRLSVAFYAACAGVIGAFLIVLDTFVAQALLLTTALGLSWMLARLTYAETEKRLPENTHRTCRLLRRMGMVAVIILIARPGCTWNEVTWQKPLLVALIDQSKSMSIRDAAQGASRADAANEALRNALRKNLSIDERFEVQVVGFGRGIRDLREWQSQPADDVTSIVGALRYAGQARSTAGDAPQAVILVSDGAETASDPQLIRPIAEDFARRRIALHALGVGAVTTGREGITLNALRVPQKVGLRETIYLNLSGTANTPSRNPISLSILWNGNEVRSETVPAADGGTNWRHEATIQPPGPGLHRLTAKASIETPSGLRSADRSAIVEVREESLKVLFLDDSLRTETAFAARALRSDPAFSVSQRVLPRSGGDSDIPRWREFDLVVLGALSQRRIDPAAISDLAKAVQEDGVGLLVAGGDSLFGLPTIVRSDLAVISPVELRNSAGIEPVSQHTKITDDGSRHPIFASMVGPNAATRDLADLVLDAQLGTPKPLATVLVAAADQAPVLVAHEVGRGRCAIAAWAATWPWALQSDEGLARHRTLWRQVARWLVNRRPAAWVITDRADYIAPSLSADTSIQVRAGISGDDAGAIARLNATANPTLRMRRIGDGTTTQPIAAGEWMRVPLTKAENEWRVSLDARNWPGGSPAAGDYVLEFNVSDPALQKPAANRTNDEFVAQTRFRIVGVDPELREPTMNVAALQDGAALSAGGSYRPVQEAAATFLQLLTNDTRRRIERPARWDFAERLAWLMLIVASAAFGGEWLLRKQSGLR